MAKRVTWSVYSRRRGITILSLCESGRVKSYDDYVRYCERLSLGEILSPSDFDREAPKSQLPSPVRTAAEPARVPISVPRLDAPRASTADTSDRASEADDNIEPPQALPGEVKTAAQEDGAPDRPFKKKRTRTRKSSSKEFPAVSVTRDED